MEHSHEQPSCCESKPRPFYKNKTVLVSAGILLTIGLSYFIAPLVPLRHAFLVYLKIMWWAVLLGLFIGGAMEYYVPREYFVQTLAGKRKRTIVYSVGMGFFASVCSHGVLAIAMQLYKKGAATSSVIAFLLASPWMSLPLTFLLIGFFGITQALYLIFSAVIIALITGWIYQAMEKAEVIGRNPHTVEISEGFSIWQDIKRRFQDHHFSVGQIKKDIKGIYHGALLLSDMVVWWILLGTALAGLAQAYLPPELFRNHMGPDLGGMLVTLLVATVIEVCSEGTAPLAFEIFRQTGALGSALVFLMAGVATDYTEIGLVWINIGKKPAFLLPLITVPQILFFGMVANMIF